MLLLLSSTSLVVNHGLASVIEMVTFIILIIIIGGYYICRETFLKKKHINRWIVFIAIFFSIGLLSHELPIEKKIVLLFTMYAILISSVMADNFMNSFEHIRLASYVLFITSLFTVFISVCGGENLITSSEGMFGYMFAFNGGIVFKNYFGGNLLCIFMGIYVYRKYCQKRAVDAFVLKIVLLAVFLSGSRGSLLLLIMFILLMNVDKLGNLKKNQRKILAYLATILSVFLFVYLYHKIALNSSTYMYRVRGVLNYFECFREERKLLLIGNSELAYMGDDSYVLNIRKVTGYDGSMENAYLNIIVKNGLVGLIGYLLIFIRYSVIFINANEQKYKVAGFSILITLLMSGLVESYLQSVHAVFGIYCYLVLSGICGCIHKEKYMTCLHT